MGLGGGFSVVGAVPVAITVSFGVRTSATIIGMGFVGFGFLLMLPGLFWCIVVRTHSFKICCFCCRKKKEGGINGKGDGPRKRKRRKKWGEDEDEDDDEFGEQEDTPALCYDRENSSIENSPSRHMEGSSKSPRERKWPPVYVDTPSLIITKAQDCMSSRENVQLKNFVEPSSMPNNNNDGCTSGNAANNCPNTKNVQAHQTTKNENIVTKKIKALYNNTKPNKSETNLHQNDKSTINNNSKTNKSNNNNNRMALSFTSSQTCDPIANTATTTTTTSPSTATDIENGKSTRETAISYILPKSLSHNLNLSTQSKSLDEDESRSSGQRCSIKDSSRNTHNNNNEGFVDDSSNNDDISSLADKDVKKICDLIDNYRLTNNNDLNDTTE
ncbi:hypothetical protein HELRODRAFT_167866 [Helobdella robusta]|uniref:Uncharacterized protein n=1 Tax=Helobdella robusta TaxID=6412 RepID=T1EZW6_HELRO|nr:hypothetical protein HELRODRAFT_167866 [Helobdella robusta]ESO10029.1 hypothetical protein HELRODRAFT_167866 [Helobdella robusta]